MRYQERNRRKRAASVLPALIEIAGRHEIVLYDPQGDELHVPARLE